MIFNENNRTYQNSRINKAYKITHIAVGNCPRVTKLGLKLKRPNPFFSVVGYANFLIQDLGI